MRRATNTVNYGRALPLAQGVRTATMSDSAAMTCATSFGRAVISTCACTLPALVVCR
jgi:hypothetical protein